MKFISTGLQLSQIHFHSLFLPCNSAVSQTTYMSFLSFLCLAHFHSFRPSFFLWFLFTPKSLCLTSGCLELNSWRSLLGKQFPSSPLNEGKRSILFSHVITCLACDPSSRLLLISNRRLQISKIQNPRLCSSCYRQAFSIWNTVFVLPSLRANLTPGRFHLFCAKQCWWSQHLFSFHADAGFQRVNASSSFQGAAL